MTVYLDLVVLLNFLVDGLLLIGANYLTGHLPNWKRTAFAALLGSLYAGICMLPAYRILGNYWGRTVALTAMAGIAYGWSWSGLRCGAIFALLSMALGGAALGFTQGNFTSLVLSAGGIACLCAVGAHAPIGANRFLPVQLKWKEKQIALTALIDTGNMLRDPVSGQSVLVVGVDVAKYIGISQEMLEDPVKTLLTKKIPGARLLPYRGVGQIGGMLLMLRFDEVKINGKVVSPMVAFTPGEIGKKESYQALAGGII